MVNISNISNAPLEKKHSKVWIWLLAVVIVLIVAAIIVWLVVKNQKTASPTTSANLNQGQHSSRGDQNGPYSHSIYKATSADGKTWKTDDKVLFEHASVPGAIFKDGVLYLYFVDASGDEDQLSVVTSKDNGQTFSDKQKVGIKDMPSYDAVDPHPELIDGKICLFYLGNFFSLPEKEKKGEKAFKIYYSESTDGVNFTDQHLVYEDKVATTDPDVFQTGDGWGIFLSQGRSMILLNTTNNGQSFEKNNQFNWNKGGVSDTYKLSDGFHTLYCGEGIQSAKGADGGILTSENITAIQGIGGEIACDPSVIQLPDGTYLMFYKKQTAPVQQANPPK